MTEGLEPATAQKTVLTWTAWVWHRIVEATMALLLFYAVVQLSERMNQQERESLPASSWFKVNEIYVPDHAQGSNPPVIYDRTVFALFRGFFVVEVQKQLDNGLWWSACSGSGVSDYEPGEAIPDNTVTWEWFVTRPCPVPPGIYRLRVSWEMKVPGWPTKNTVALSNTFTVYSNGAPD